MSPTRNNNIKKYKNTETKLKSKSFQIQWVYSFCVFFFNHPELHWSYRINIYCKWFLLKALEFYTNFRVRCRRWPRMPVYPVNDPWICDESASAFIYTIFELKRKFDSKRWVVKYWSSKTRDWLFESSRIENVLPKITLFYYTISLNSLTVFAYQLGIAILKIQKIQKPNWNQNVFKSNGFIDFVFFSLTPLNCFEVTGQMSTMNMIILLTYVTYSE
jgi:hypothetical protein